MGRQEVVRKELKYASGSVSAPSTCDDRKRSKQCTPLYIVDNHCFPSGPHAWFYIKIFFFVHVFGWGLVARDTLPPFRFIGLNSKFSCFETRSIKALMYF